MRFTMSSAICFNLDQSKILSSGNGIIRLSNLVMPFFIEERWGRLALHILVDWSVSRKSHCRTNLSE